MQHHCYYHCPYLELRLCSNATWLISQITSVGGRHPCNHQEHLSSICKGLLNSSLKSDQSLEKEQLLNNSIANKCCLFSKKGLSFLKNIKQILCNHHGPVAVPRFLIDGVKFSGKFTVWNKLQNNLVLAKFSLNVQYLTEVSTPLTFV